MQVLHSGRGCGARAADEATDGGMRAEFKFMGTQMHYTIHINA
jgi:hypothetical protein